jgi:hypothetical protein
MKIMKLRIKPLMFAAVIFLSACGSDDKKPAATPSKDSAVAQEEMPPMDTSGFDEPAVTTPQDDKLSLVFNLPKGKNIAYIMKLDTKAKNGERTMESAVESSYDMVVINEKDRIKTLKTTYKKMVMSMNMGGMKMEFSSEKKGEGMMAMLSNMFAAMKGKSFTMDVNEQGEILKVEGFDKIGEAMARELQVPETQKEGMMETFKQQFSDEAVKEAFGQSFGIFPDKPVKIGDKWTKTSKSMGKSGMTLNTTYTVKNIKDGKAYLDVYSKVNTGDPKAPGTQTGKMVVDTKTGLVTDANLNVKVEGEKTMTANTRITAKGL